MRNCCETEQLTRLPFPPNRPLAISEICLAYLNLLYVKSPSASPTLSVPMARPSPSAPLDIRKSHTKIELSSYPKTPTPKSLDRYDSHMSARSLLKVISPTIGVRLTPGPERFTVLHYISLVGASETALVN